MPKVSVRKLTFQGDKAVELRTAQLRLVVVTSRGPRVAFLGQPEGENLILWKPGKYRRGQWDLMGGHRLWLTRPDADEAEETYLPDNGACSVELRRDGFTVTAAPDATSRTTRSITVRALAAGRVELRQSVRNDSDMLWSGGLWGLTCTLPTPTTTYVCPLSDGSSWDTASFTIFKGWGGGHTSAYNDPQYSFTDDAMHVRSLGAESKRMVRAEPGILAMHDPKRGVLFAKRAVYQRGAVYPMGSNLAFYTGIDSFMVEMETQSPFASLKPGESHSHVETWALEPAGKQVPSAKAVVRLFA